MSAKKFVTQFSEEGRPDELVGHSGVAIRRQIGSAAPQVVRAAELVAKFSADGEWRTLDENGDVRFEQADRRASAERANIVRATDTIKLDGSPVISDAMSRTTAGESDDQSEVRRNSCGGRSRFHLPGQRGRERCESGLRSRAYFSRYAERLDDLRRRHVFRPRAIVARRVRLAVESDRDLARRQEIASQRKCSGGVPTSYLAGEIIRRADGKVGHSDSAVGTDSCGRFTRRCSPIGATPGKRTSKAALRLIRSKGPCNRALWTCSCRPHRQKFPLRERHK